MNHEPSQTTTDSSSRRIHFRRRAFGILMALIPAVMIAPLSACAWKPEIVRADPTLTSRDLVNGKIAIMPVKFDNDKATPKERYRTVSGLRRAVQQLREDIPVMSNPTLNKALEGSLEEEAVMLRIYDITGSDPNAFTEYRQSLGARYLILSRLNYDQRDVGGGGRLPNSTTESTLSGTVSILDVTEGRVVWEGKFSTTRSGVDTIVDPSPSVHALPFFSTFVKAWPAAI